MVSLAEVKRLSLADLAGGLFLAGIDCPGSPFRIGRAGFGGTLEPPESAAEFTVYPGDYWGEESFGNARFFFIIVAVRESRRFLKIKTSLTFAYLRLPSPTFVLIGHCK